MKRGPLQSSLLCQEFSFESRNREAAFLVLAQMDEIKLDRIAQGFSERFLSFGNFVESLACATPRKAGRLWPGHKGTTFFMVPFCTRDLPHAKPFVCGPSCNVANVTGFATSPALTKRALFVKLFANDIIGLRFRAGPQHFRGSLMQREGSDRDGRVMELYLEMHTLLEKYLPPASKTDDFVYDRALGLAREIVDE